ncbi:NAD(P)-dependent oxidoreductase [Egibacter rhizosphaerae]|uniref:NAD(P)-dependent oxidoreductase n=1 Tax=Egibacter rhizosphaerae TaxID=1670831 RepID=UPI00197AB555|nr:NAD(P)-dependent oxidoreductase [Egibacter rhizosphaerae]
MTAAAEPAALVTSRSFASASRGPERRLERAGLTVRRGPSDHGMEGLRPLLDESVAWIAGTGPITTEHLDAAPRLEVIARYGIGVEAADLGAAAARGIRVTNTPGANSESVADHTLALLLALLRGVGRNEPGSAPPPPQARELGALTVGLVGLGRVGRAVAERLQGFGGQVLGHDPSFADRPPAEAGNVRLCTLEELAATSDVVSLHRPGGETLVDRALLDRLPRRALLVNTARADLVDEPAVAEFLRSGRLGGYATDVGAGPDSPLRAAPNLIATDHVSAHTAEAIDRMGTMAAEEVVRALAGEPPANPVVDPASGNVRG